MMDLMQVVQEALDVSSDVLMKYYGVLESVEQKGAIDLVTVADRESEERIKEVIRGAFPHHQILAEESGEDYAGRASDYRWIVDPLDGTTNFSHTFPLFSISIAVERNGSIVAAGVENPFYHERFLAEQGAGATLNGRRIAVSSTASLSHSLIVTGFPYDRRERLEHYLAYWSEFLMRVHGVLRLGSAALDLCSVAAGRLDGFWEEKLNPWDTAAGWLIVEEAGGRVTNFSGGRFSPYRPELLATNGRIHPECLEVLQSMA